LLLSPAAFPRLTNQIFLASFRNLFSSAERRAKRPLGKFAAFSSVTICPVSWHIQSWLCATSVTEECILILFRSHQNYFRRKYLRCLQRFSAPDSLRSAL
jgi:hypothetical protein